MRRTRLIIVAAVLAAVVPTTSASAVEGINFGVRNPVISENSGPVTPKRLWMIGDSLTNDWTQVQTNYERFLFVEAGWYTRFEATMGATLMEHWQEKPRWRTFQRAREDKSMRAVFVELGTNDTSAVWPTASNYQAQLKLIDTYLTKTVEYLRATGRCIVVMGVDARGNRAIDPAVGKFYNNRIKALATGNVHYADYVGLINQNLVYHDGLYQGSEWVHPKTDAAKLQLAIWVRDQIRFWCKF